MKKKFFLGLMTLSLLAPSLAFAQEIKKEVPEIKKDAEETLVVPDKGSQMIEASLRALELIEQGESINSPELLIAAALLLDKNPLEPMKEKAEGGTDSTDKTPTAKSVLALAKKMAQASKDKSLEQIIANIESEIGNTRGVVGGAYSWGPRSLTPGQTDTITKTFSGYSTIYVNASLGAVEKKASQLMAIALKDQKLAAQAPVSLANAWAAAAKASAQYAAAVAAGSKSQLDTAQKAIDAATAAVNYWTPIAKSAGSTATAAYNAAYAAQQLVIQDKALTAPELAAQKTLYAHLEAAEVAQSKAEASATTLLEAMRKAYNLYITNQTQANYNAAAAAGLAYTKAYDAAVTATGLVVTDLNAYKASLTKLKVDLYDGSTLVKSGTGQTVKLEYTPASKRNLTIKVTNSNAVTVVYIGATN